MRKSLTKSKPIIVYSIIDKVSGPFTSINFSSVNAQEYGSYDYDDDDTYSQYPTEVNKYECRTGPFEGFFVSSVEFRKHVKFDDKDDDRRDSTQR